MLHPSYTDLMKVVNKDVEEGETKVVNSRYSIVMATAKRAREIIDDAEPLVPVKNGEKPLSIAIDELNQAKIKVAGEDDSQEKLQEAGDETAQEAGDETAQEPQEEARADSDENGDVPA